MAEVDDLWGFYAMWYEFHEHDFDNEGKQE
ncbi:hypothetical protein PAHA111176_06495 [Parendozoicomonas haliclonae]|uniref:Uncharacterized protein n=1 Tax=Parendozoicomonas haliclonae TaxID=1960125 RepID=A0A1X7AFI3_9GAMM|nr:hypothetical protein EHSB41UT_00637 [Parendozoicomonas haliclonae]